MFTPSMMLLIGAVVAWYFAVRALADLLARARGRSLLRAASAWIPVVLLVSAAMAVGDLPLAIGAVFASSVACLSLVLGSVMIASDTTSISDSHQREWSFVLPVAIVMLLIGLKAQFAVVHVLVLVVLAMVLGLVWSDRNRVYPAEPIESTEPRQLDPLWKITLQLLLAIGVCAVAALMAIHATSGIAAQWRLPSSGFVAAVLIGPALTLPLVGIGTQMAHERRQGEVLSTIVALVLLNLLVLLPGLVLARWVQTREYQQIADVSNRIELLSKPVMTFPHQLWRVDTLMLVVLGMALVPMSLGRWTPGRLEGLALIAAYAVYLLMSALATLVG